MRHGVLAAAPALNRPLPAIALRLTSAGLFAVMAALLKLADDAGVALVHLMFWRFGFGLIPLLVYVRLRSTFAALKTGGAVRQDSVVLAYRVSIPTTVVAAVFVLWTQLDALFSPTWPPA